MPVSDVQLDTGIGVGRAQVFKPLDLSDVADLQMRKKQLDEAAKARKLKEQEDKKDKIFRQINTPYDMLERDLTKYNQLAKEAFDSAEKNGDSRETQQAVFKLAQFGKMAQAFKKDYVAKITDVSKKGDEMIFGMDELNNSILATSDPNSENYSIELDPNHPMFDAMKDLGNRYTKLSQVNLIKPDKDAVGSITRAADSLGDELVSTMTPELTTYENLNTSKAFKDKADLRYEAVKNSFAAENLKQQYQYYDHMSEADAEKRVKDLFYTGIDTSIKTKLNQKAQEKEFKRGSGGAMENDIYRVTPDVLDNGLHTLEINTIKTGEGGTPRYVDVNEVVNGKLVPVKAVPVAINELPGGGVESVIDVPILDYTGKETGQYRRTTSPDYRRITNEIGINPYEVWKGVGTGHKVKVTSKSGTSTEKKEATKAVKIEKHATKKSPSKEEQDNWNAAWAKLKHGFSMIGLDGKTYTKK